MKLSRIQLRDLEMLQHLISEIDSSLRLLPKYDIYDCLYNEFKDKKGVLITTPILRKINKDLEKEEM